MERLTDETMQLSLDYRDPDPEPVAPVPVRRPAPVSDHHAAFLDFHHSNPHVYDALVTMARELVGRGHTRVGINMLWEVLRWERLRGQSTDSADGYRLNNNHAPFYARLIMATEPDLAGVFETRRLRAA